MPKFEYFKCPIKKMSLPPLFNQGFPNYSKESFGDVDIYWYQSEFTQSQYPPGQEISEACTLICLFVAQRISHLDLEILNLDYTIEFNVVIAEAIIEGNSIHSYILEKKLVKHRYLNTEEALKFGGKKLSMLKEWKFKVFHEYLDTSLYKNITSFLNQWFNTSELPNLYMLLITCGRTIIFIFQQRINKVTLFDPHGHSKSRHLNKGLVVAQSPLSSLEDLCKWYIKDVIHNCYKLEANKYELACLYYNRTLRTNECKCSTSYSM